LFFWPVPGDTRHGGSDQLSVFIQAKIRAMAEADVLKLVPDRVIRDIKREDQHPHFKAFVVSHEGIATPNIIGVGKTIQNWFASAVKSLAMKLNIGTKVFSGHEENNDHNDYRKTVGEVIGKGLEMINGLLSTVAVTYIYPQFKDDNFDIASIEADIMIPKDEREFEINEPDVLGVTGIAVGDSKIEKPAFPGATLQVALQAFAEKTPKGEHKMTLEEIKSAVQEGKFKPSEVFNMKDLTADPLVTEHVEEKTNNLRGYNIRKIADAEAKVEKLEAENKDLKGKADEFAKHTLRETGREVFTTILKERKIDGDKKFDRYIQKMYDKAFTPTEETALKQDVNTFVDKQMDEYKDLFGEAVKVGEKISDDKDGSKDTGVGADDKGTQGGDGTNLLDPKNNELIPQD